MDRFWTEVTNSVLKANYTDEVVFTIDSNIDICETKEFKKVWNKASKSVKIIIANAIVEEYIDFIVDTYCWNNWMDYGKEEVNEVSWND